MNRDTVKRNWKQFKGEVKSQWGKLTGDQSTGKIQESHGVSKGEAEAQIRPFEQIGPLAAGSKRNAEY